ncbi:MAG TPA: hypothetical protein VGB45_13705 [Abditibacterium sp.]|jgi:hypothetical protein
MAERKKTPDILADLLSTDRPTQSASHSIKHNGKTEKLYTSETLSGKTERQKDSKEESPPSQLESTQETESGNEGKTKVTFYLSEDTIDLLEDAQRTLRRLSRAQGGAAQPKGLTSKSAILEEALKLVCGQVESEGLSSPLASKLF